MEYEKLIKEELDKISFLEIKEGKDFTLAGKTYAGPMNLPIRTENLLKIVKDDPDEITFEYFIDGIIYIISLADDQDMLKYYLDILEHFTDNIKGYVMHRALDFLDQEKIKEALVYINSLIKMGYEDERILFTLGITMENMDLSLLDEEEKNIYIIEIMNTYEKTLNYDENFDLAYYKLGYIYRDLMQFKKSQLVFEKFLALSEDELKLEEVRQVLSQMEGNVLLEEAIEALNNQDTNRALDKFNSVAADQLTDIHYYHFSLIYLDLALLDEAENYINMALEIRDEKVYHSQRALIYQAQGENDQAIKEIENTIDKYGPDFNLNYNLASIYYRQGDLDTSLGNYKIAYDINPSSQVKEIIEYLEKEIEEKKIH